MKETRPFQFRLDALFLVTTVVAVVVAIKTHVSFGLTPVELILVGVVAILLFGSKLPPRNWR